MSEPLLSVEGLCAYYGGVQVLRDVSLKVEEGEVVALLGPNGAGKTTLMKAISHAVRISGSVTFAGEEIGRRSTAQIARAGIGHVPEGRGTFTDLTVLENLQLAMSNQPKGRSRSAASRLDAIYEVFPKLGELSPRLAGKLSGGEQQMLAIARAVLAGPRLLLIDEPSTGLAPNLVAEMYERLGHLISTWEISVLIAEQNVHHALGIARRAYVLASGRVALEGTSDELRGNQDSLASAYLGEGSLTTSAGGH